MPLAASTALQGLRDHGHIEPGQRVLIVGASGGVGTRSPSECRRALAPKGTLVLSSGESGGRWIGPIGRIVKALALSPFVSQKMVSFTVKPNKEDLQCLRQLIEAGKLAPVIDRTYPLAEVPEAIRYLEEGHA